MSKPSIDSMIKGLEKVNGWNCTNLTCDDCPFTLLVDEMGSDDCVTALRSIIETLEEVK